MEIFGYKIRVETPDDSHQGKHKVYKAVPKIDYFYQCVLAYLRAFNSLPQIGYSFVNNCGDGKEFGDEHMIVTQVNISDELIIIRLEYDVIV